MKTLIVAIVVLCSTTAYGQVRIHAHNDYEKAIPLFNALENKAFSIEADVFLRNADLLVAHSKEEIKPGRTLSSLYINPIITLFKKHKGRVSPDTAYRFSLMIDIKEGGELAIKRTASLLSAHRFYFDRNLNRNAVEVIISGDRGNISSWKSFPSYIHFDGRPYEKYDGETIQRVPVISDSYSTYAENPAKLRSVLDEAHRSGKLFRFWGTPDNEFTWKFFMQSGVDIINTDKPEACRKFLQKIKSPMANSYHL